MDRTLSTRNARATPKTTSIAYTYEVKIDGFIYSVLDGALQGITANANDAVARHTKVVGDTQGPFWGSPGVPDGPGPSLG